MVCEEELCEFIAGMIGKLLDGGELEELRVVLESGELFDEEVKLEESVELESSSLLDSEVMVELSELRLGDELELEGLLVVEKKISLIDDEEDEVVVKKVDVVDVVVVVEGRTGDEGMEIKLELELELGTMIKDLLEVVVVALVVEEDD